MHYEGQSFKAIVSNIVTCKPENKFHLGKPFKLGLINPLPCLHHLYHAEHAVKSMLIMNWLTLYIYFLLYYDHFGFICLSLKCVKKSAAMFLFPDEYTSPW